VRARALIWLAAALPLAAAAEVALDDPGARLRATREWHGADAGGRGRLFEAARRERDRYSMGSGRAASGVSAFARVPGSSFVSVGPTRADFAVNGDRYEEVDSGRVRQILPHPLDPDVLYLSTAGGGVWKTYGASAPSPLWEPLTDALGTTAVGTLAMDPANPDILFLGFGDPFDVQQPGITRSTDGGGSWSPPVELVATYTFGTETLQRVAGAVTDIQVDPRNSLVVLAATDIGLFRSIDGGSSWQHLPLSSSAARFFFFWSLAYLGNDGWLVAGQAADITAPPSPNGGGPLALWRSSDDGATWTYATAALPGGERTAQLIGRVTMVTARSTLADPASARVYLLASTIAGSAQHDLFRSDDAGLSFQSLRVNATSEPQNPNPDQPNLDVLRGQAWYNQALFVDPANPDAVLIGGQLSMVRSLDAGRSWSVLSDWLPHNSENSDIDRPYVHADLHAFAVGADGALYAGSDGGLFVSANALSEAAAKVSFTSRRNEGLVTHLAYSVACAPESWPAAAQGFVAGGLQDNGTRLRDGATTTFNQIFGGDGVGLAVSASTHPDAALRTDVPDAFLVSVPGGIFLSRNGGQSFDRFTTGLAQLPFLVRIARESSAGDSYLTFTGAPAGFYRWREGETSWTSASGTLHWQDSNRDTPGFTTVDGTAIGLRNLAAHPAKAGVWGAVSNRFTYMTADGGAHWLAGVQPRPAGSPGGAYLLSSLAFDPLDLSGRTYYLTALSTSLIDPQNNFYGYPPDFGHVFRTRNGGLTWESLGAQGVASGGLPDVGADVIKVDPNDPGTLYVGTEIGLYRSTDSGATWSRFGAGTLPLVEVTDLCIAPGSQRLTAATYGRGFWQIDTAGGATPAGVRGLGDTNFDGRIDGEDLIDLADGLGATQSSPVYRWQADLVGAANQIDQADLDALLAKFGGRP
jgi:photosystem II stability/assembly factor-like uncharacterized protein